MRILIAEDEPDMQRILRLYLTKEGYETETASDGKAALDLLCEKHYDLLIADWMMPKMSGIELCEAVRSYKMDVKIIMLTAKSTTENEIAGLTCGADDYIRKPFEPKILLLRIRKILNAGEELTCGNLCMNITKQTVFLEGVELHLTQTEWSLLKLLIGNKGNTLTREFLLERVWGMDYEGDERTLDTHIRRLRNKIGKEYITTYVGTGYRLEEPGARDD